MSYFFGLLESQLLAWVWQIYVLRLIVLVSPSPPFPSSLYLPHTPSLSLLPPSCCAVPATKVYERSDSQVEKSCKYIPIRKCSAGGASPLGSSPRCRNMFDLDIHEPPVPSRSVFFDDFQRSKELRNLLDKYMNLVQPLVAIRTHHVLISLCKITKLAPPTALLCLWFGRRRCE